MMQVEVPITLTMSSVRQPAPIASQCASKAPTGNRNAWLEPEFVGPDTPTTSGDLIRRGVFALQFLANTREQRIHFYQKSLRRQAAQLGFHSHLWPIAQTLRLTFLGSVMPQSVAATMSQCSKAETNSRRLSGL